MNDNERFVQLEKALYPQQIRESERQLIINLLNSFDNINHVHNGVNLLRLIGSHTTTVVVNVPGVGYRNEVDPSKAQFFRECINRVLDRGINRDFKMGKYQAPLLFFVQDPRLFGHLCACGFDPNERLTDPDHEGYPYFMLHHDFSIDNYRVAKQFGFDPYLPIAEGKNLLQLFFSRFIEFDLSTLREFVDDFPAYKNVPNPTTGLTPLQTYLTAEGGNQFSYEIVRFLLAEGFDKNSKTEKAFFTSDFEIPQRSTALDILNLKYQAYKPGKWALETIALFK